jgi:hypothetical protein
MPNDRVLRPILAVGVVVKLRLADAELVGAPLAGVVADLGDDLAG